MAKEANVPALVIIARNLSEAATSLLVAHNRMNLFKVMAVKLPGLNAEDRMGALDDLSVLTGAKAFVKIAGDSWVNIHAAQLGQARRVWADKWQFGMVNPGGDPRKVRQHVQRLKTTYQSLLDLEDRKKIQERIGSLQGGSVTLWIGGFTEPEINARKSQAQRAALTMRAAVQEGAVPGGGLALLKCKSVLETRYRRAGSVDERAAYGCLLEAAYGCLLEALEAPARVIYQNAGYEPGEVLAQLNGKSSLSGFDVVRGRVVNMMDAGILDSLMVLKSAVRNAVSTAALALTIDSLVHVAAPEMVGKPT